MVVRENGRQEVKVGVSDSYEGHGEKESQRK